MYYDVSYVRKGYDSVKHIIHLDWRSPIFWNPRHWCV